MRIILQRVKSASVSVNATVKSKIEKGYLLLVGITNDDSQEDIEYLARKILNLKLFPSSDGAAAEWKENVVDVGGCILSVSQFTLFAKTAKGSKPDFHRAAPASISRPLYEQFLAKLRQDYSAERIQDGAFGELMEVELINDGPITIVLDSKEKTL